MEKALSVFLSHSNLDEPQVKIVQRFLGETGIKPWVSYDDIHSSDYGKLIARQIKTNDVFLLILSRNSAISGNVQDECYLALKNKKSFIVYELEPTPLPEALELPLARKQRIQSFKFPAESLERLARIIIEESGLKWDAYSVKAKDTASRIRHEQSESEKEDHRKLRIYKELYWNCRTRNGRYRADAAITVIDRETLKRLKVDLGLTDALTAKVHAEFDRRKKSDFTSVLSSTLKMNELTLIHFDTLEKKRVDCCVSTDEVKKIICSRGKLPSLSPNIRIALQNDKPVVSQKDVGWIIDLFDLSREQVHPIKTVALSPKNEAPVPVLLEADKSTKVAANKRGVCSKDEARKKAPADENARREKAACETAAAEDRERRGEVGLFRQVDSPAKTDSSITLLNTLSSNRLVPDETDHILADQVYNGELFTSIDVSQIVIERDELVILGKPAKDSGRFPKNRIATAVKSLHSVDIFRAEIRINEMRPSTYTMIRFDGSTHSHSRMIEFLKALALPTGYQGSDPLESIASRKENVKMSTCTRALSNGDLASASIKQLKIAHNLDLVARRINEAVSLARLNSLKGVQANSTHKDALRMATNHRLECLSTGKTLLYYNESLLRKRNGILVFEKGILLSSLLHKASFIFFGSNLCDSPPYPLNVYTTESGVRVSVKGMCLLQRKSVDANHEFSLPEGLRKQSFAADLQNMLTKLDKAWQSYASSTAMIRRKLQSLKVYQQNRLLFDTTPIAINNGKSNHSAGRLIACYSELLQLTQPCPSFADFYFCFSNRKPLGKGGFSIVLFSQSLYLVGLNCFNCKSSRQFTEIKYTDIRELSFRISQISSGHLQVDVVSELFVGRATVGFDGVLHEKDGFEQKQIVELSNFIESLWNRSSVNTSITGTSL